MSETTIALFDTQAYQFKTSLEFAYDAFHDIRLALGDARDNRVIKRNRLLVNLRLSQINATYFICAECKWVGWATCWPVTTPDLVGVIDKAVDDLELIVGDL